MLPASFRPFTLVNGFHGEETKKRKCEHKMQMQNANAGGLFLDHFRGVTKMLRLTHRALLQPIRRPSGAVWAFVVAADALEGGVPSAALADHAGARFGHNHASSSSVALCSISQPSGGACSRLSLCCSPLTSTFEHMQYPL